MEKFWFKAQKDTSEQNEKNNSVFSFNSSHLVPIEFDYEVSFDDLGIDNLVDINILDPKVIEEAITQHVERSLNTKVELFSYNESEEDTENSAMDSSDVILDYSEDYKEHTKSFHKHEDECDICRDDVCEEEFLIRLGGLTKGTSQYLSRFVGCNISLELIDGKKIHAEIFCVREGMLEVRDPNACEEPVLVIPGQSVNFHCNSTSHTQKSKHPVMIIPISNIKCFEIEQC